MCALHLARGSLGRSDKKISSSHCARLALAPIAQTLPQHDAITIAMPFDTKRRACRELCRAPRLPRVASDYTHFRQALQTSTCAL